MSGGGVLAVVPTYEERGTVAELVRALLVLPVAVDVLIVDDGSPDGTGAVADELAGADARVSVLHRAARTGLGPALRAGLAFGAARGYDVLAQMDADLSHDPGQLPRLLDRLHEADVVIGSRYVTGGRIERWPRRRRLLSRGGNAYVRALTRLPVSDATSGFRAFRRPVLEAIAVQRLRSDGYAFQIETALRAWRAGFRVEEVPITFVERREGASKLSRRVVVEASWRVPLWAFGDSVRSAGHRPRAEVADADREPRPSG